MLSIFLAILLSICSFSLPLSSDLGYLWHLTDAHIDLNYTVGSSADCDQSGHRKYDMCCRQRQPNRTVPAGLFGSPAYHCDIPLQTFEGTLSFMKSLPVQPDMVIYTGDSVAHDGVDSFQGQSEPLNLYHMLLVINRLYDTFSVPVLPSIGNVDCFPGEMLGHPPFSSWVLTPTASTLLSQGSATSSEADLLKTKGYFSHVVGPYRVLMVNTQWINSINLFVHDWPKKKHHEMVEWIQSELELARSLGQKVIITGHIPPNHAPKEVFLDWNHIYVDMMRNYSDVVAMQLYGHEHDDRFGLEWNADFTEVISYYLVASSLTTKTYKNPSVRLISYNQTTGAIDDIVTYYCDINEANQEGTMENCWKEEYSMKKFYGLETFEASEFGKVMERLESDDGFWKEFIGYFTASYGGKSCEGSCRTKLVCEMKWTTAEKIEECEKKK